MIVINRDVEDINFIMNLMVVISSWILDILIGFLLILILLNSRIVIFILFQLRFELLVLLVYFRDKL
jgi:hypothetical protein